MANSLESQAEEDEKKNGIFLFSPQQIMARKQCKQKSQYTVKGGLCTLRNKGAEVWKVSNAGFLYGAWEEGFHPILSTIKTKQALSLICLRLHFEQA